MNFTKPVIPRVSEFHDPALCLETFFDQLFFFPARSDMRDKMTVWIFPTYPASKQRFSTGRRSPGCVLPEEILFSSSSSRTTQSFRFAAVTTIDNGMPCSSTSRCLLLPFFPPVGGVGPDRFLRHWRLAIGTVGRLPLPCYSLQFVVFCHSCFP